MKLIIDIPDHLYTVIKNKECTHRNVLTEAVYDGIPLDEIRAEIEALNLEPTAYDIVDGNPIKDAIWETIADVLQIIDKYRNEVSHEMS